MKTVEEKKAYNRAKYEQQRDMLRTIREQYRKPLDKNELKDICSYCGANRKHWQKRNI